VGQWAFRRKLLSHEYREKGKRFSSTQVLCVSQKSGERRVERDRLRESQINLPMYERASVGEIGQGHPINVRERDEKGPVKRLSVE